MNVVASLAIGKGDKDTDKPWDIPLHLRLKLAQRSTPNVSKIKDFVFPTIDTSNIHFNNI